MSPATTVRVALVVFVLAWIFGPTSSARPFRCWSSFLIALGLELNFLVSALRGRTPRSVPTARRRTSTGSATGTRRKTDELVLVHEGDEESGSRTPGESDEELEELIEEARGRGGGLLGHRC